MKRWILAACALALAAPLFAQTTEGKYASYIQTTGHAEREIVPDEYWLSIVVNERESKGKITVEQQQGEMLDALRKLGIDTDSHLRTADLSSEFFRRGSSVATARYELKLGSAAEVAAVYAALDAIGISNISILRVSHSRLDEFEQELRAEAMRDARDRARTLAEAVEQRLGPCFYIYDSNSGVAPLYLNSPLVRAKAVMGSEAAADSTGPETPEFRNIELDYDVQARFVLEP